MRRTGMLLCLLTLLVMSVQPSGPDHPEQSGTVTAAILQSWQGDFPVEYLERLPEGQRDAAVGYISDEATFSEVWKSFMPAEETPEIDFTANLVFFARNTQFYNRIRIGQVKVEEGVAELLTMETMSSQPIENTVAFSMVVVAREGIHGLRVGDETVPVK